MLVSWKRGIQRVQKPCVRLVMKSPGPGARMVPRSFSTRARSQNSRGVCFGVQDPSKTKKKPTTLQNPHSPSPPAFFKRPARSFCHQLQSTHSKVMQVVPVPVNSDNYAYLIIDQKNGICAAVDPAEPSKVISAAKRHNAKITSVLTTHHHGDHSGGNVEMVKLIDPKLPVYGGDNRIPGLSNKVAQDDKFKIGELQVTVHFTPCHTSGHVLFEVASSDSNQPKALFTGDTLFVGGCGRFFEGTAKDMYYALNSVIGKMAGNTQLWVGHEYTEKNLLFAQSVEPNNQDVKKKLTWTQSQRKQGLYTVPSTIDDEKLFNPFLRTSSVELKKTLGVSGESDETKILALLRSKKDNWGVGGNL